MPPGTATSVQSPTATRPTYFLVRSFDGEWGSEGMEGTFLAGDWKEWLPETVAAFRALGAHRRAGLIERVARLASLAAGARSDQEQGSPSPAVQTVR